MRKELITLLVASVSIANGAFAGTPRANAWFEAITATAETRPRDAISAFDRISALAADARSWGEYALAAEMRAAALAEIAGKDAALARIRALQESLAAAPAPEAKIFLEASLAWAFSNFAQSYRAGTLRGSDDTLEPDAALPENIAEWSNAQLREAAAAHYENVLAQSDLLKKIPLAAVKTPKVFSAEDLRKIRSFLEKHTLRERGSAEDLDELVNEITRLDILTLNDAPAAEFPTLYDFIARDAEKFYTAFAPGAFPQEKAELPAPEILLAPTAEFLDSVPAADLPAKSPALRALQILRARTQFHAGDADRSALARAELDRIHFAQNKCGEKATPALEAALKKFISDYEYFPISAEASALLAEIYIAEKREPEAHEIVEKAAAKFGNALNANRCKEILAQLEKVELTPFEFPNVWTSSIATPVYASAKNVKQIRFRAVPADWRDYLKKEHNRTNRLSQKEITELLDAPEAVLWNLPLEQFHDFREHRYNLEIPAEKLSPGFYFVFVAPDSEPFEGKNAKSKSAPIPVWVSDIAVITERDGYQAVKLSDGGNASVRVVNALTGMPIEGATVSAWNKARWGGERISVAPVKTDALGIAEISGLKKDRDPLLLVEAELPAQGDAAGSDAGTQIHAVSLESFSRSSEPKIPEDNGSRIAIFPDRNVFRPGQKISFKGVFARKEMPKNPTAEVFPGKKVKICLESNVSGKREIVSETEAWTNGFGSFAGTLDIPREILLGNLNISAESEGAPRSLCTVRVEEYRKPKSEIKISGSEQPQILGGNASAIITGTSLTGAPLDGAKVRWNVSTYDFDEQVRKEIAAGEGALDAAGTLKISWKTKRRKLNDGDFSVRKLSPQEHRERELDLSADFEISAEIVDSNGETVTENEFVTVSNSSFDLVADYRNLSFGEDVPVTFRRSEKTQTPVPVKAEIFRVNEPEKLTRALYENFSDPQATELGEKVFSAETKTVSEKEDTSSLVVPAGTLTPGYYRVIATCRDDFSQEIRTESELIVLDDSAEKFPLNRAFFAAWKDEKTPTEHRVGETAKFIWGSAIPGSRAFVEIFINGKESRSFYTEPNRTQQIIEIPITEDLKGKSVSVHISQAALGKVNRGTFDFTVSAEKTLNIEPRQFNTQLEPGTPQIWAFKITRADGSPAADTEILAGLYDISAESLLYRSRSDLWKTQAGKLAPGVDWSFKAFFSPSNYQSRRYFSYPQTASQFSAFLLPDWTYTKNHYGYAPVYFAPAYFGARNEMRAMGAIPVMEAAPAPVALKSSRATQASADEMREEEGIDGNAAPAPASPLAFPTRKNLQETAFFYPFLQTDENGIVTMQFVAPEALTRWRLRVFAHDKQLRKGTFEETDISTSKDLMVQPDAPRFLREGDEIKFPVKITNRGNAELTGTLRADIEFFDASGKKIALENASSAEQKFAVPAQTSKTLFRTIRVPLGAVAMNFRASGISGKISDGESAALSVLPREVVITESRTALVRPNASAKLTFEKLGAPGANEDSPRSRSFTLDAPAAAYDNILLSLPHIAEQAQETSSSDSVLYRLYVNALAKTICDANPQIRERIEHWKLTQPGKFDSPLAANAQNTPYAGIAQKEGEERRAVEIFFNENQIREEIRRALNELRERSRANNGAGWSWFPNSRCGINRQITQEILVGLGRLRERIGDAQLKTELADLARSALDAQTAWLDRCYNACDGKPQTIDSAIARHLYLCSLFADLISAKNENNEAWKYYLGEARKAEFWTKLPRMSQAQLALALWRSGEKDVPAKIVESLRQRAIYDEQLGMYWNDLPTLPLWLPQYSPIETQAATIEAFSEIAQDKKAVEEMKIWLLTRKQTHAWKSSRASANAVYALLCENGETQDAPENAAEQLAQTPAITLTNADGEKLAPGTLVPEPALAEISAKNEGDAPAFVAAHWTFSQPLSAVRADAPDSGFSVKKTVFKRERAAGGKFILRPARAEILKPGDEIIVRLTVSTDRDFEFVCLKDFRASGCEPAETLSGWRNNHALWYYGEPRDTETRFYFDRLPAGTHVFEYAQRVRTSGLYSSGFAEIRSLYAPEFSAHSSSESLVSM